MKVTIVADDSLVGVDEEFKIIDLSTLNANIHAVQWNETAGHIEYKDYSSNLSITDISPYQSFIDAWTAAPSE